MDGGAGSDVLSGGSGSDQFKFSSALGAGDIDTITDFSRGQDKLLLDSAIFSRLVGIQNITSNLVLGGGLMQRPSIATTV